MQEDRFALCFDSDRDQLGEVALRLLRMGIDVLYAETADEALLLADDAGARIHAVIVPPTIASADLDRVVGRLEGAREGKPPSIVVVGERPPDEARAALRAAGAEWAVWNPSDDNALRFAVNAALTLPSEIVPRSEPRVPSSLMASFSLGDARSDAIVYTLSPRGAFLETPKPPPVSTLLEVEIWLPTLRVSTAAKVLYVNAAGSRRRMSWPVGVGVLFEGLSERCEARLRSYVEEQAQASAV